ncbi:D-alanyl-D-alanine carboxypeptidase [Planktotalea frisia]|uniref:D-alanyl-D-alanine carboxypeptidase DacF n=1 Tax=Planktotalea frisia TaxID=696762 RepID=A0A1L9NTN1_9RHOB|nr:D-alanyl-D-alanine carboxypeptidase DacF precursor [Planktotalea frisia]PZX24015.1 D-alanyl-D-alanine carboxypeptidase [Planktotalea frisia]
MKVRHTSPARIGLLVISLLWLVVALPLSVSAAPYAAYVMDARTGEVLHTRNADTRLHPASLTKMMTLYVAFQAIENGEISLDTVVKISSKAAAEQPSKLGLRSGQRIKFRYLIRAAAVKSANDAATAIGETLEGSEAAFARRMTRTAKSLGMSKTTFKNAHGLTEQGHLSTASDMSKLGRHLLYDYPDYYNLFSRISTDAGMKTVPNTNRRLLSNYKGADGIKTGYTRAAGFNLVASAERGQERIIATVFGGRSTATRNARVAELLDMGFKRAPSRVALRKPAKPAYGGSRATAKTIRVVRAVKKSLRPKARGLRPETAPVLVSLKDDVRQALVEAQVNSAANAQVAAVAPSSTAAVTRSIKPAARPKALLLASLTQPKPEPRSAPKQEVLTRVSTSGGRHWGINIGRYPNRYRAERVLLKTALAEMSALDGARRSVTERKSGYDANFVGMTRDSADLACRRLAARNVQCFMVGPSS